MRIYKIPISWEVSSETLIEADTLEEAIEKAYDEQLPTNGEYLEGSFEVWEEGIEIIEDDLEKFRL